MSTFIDGSPLKAGLLSRGSTVICYYDILYVYNRKTVGMIFSPHSFFLKADKLLLT